MRRLPILVTLSIIFLITTNFTDPQIVSGQGGPTCSSILPQISEKLGVCKGTDRGQLCYGNPALAVDYRDPANKPAFSQPGNMIPVNAVKTVSTGRLNLQNNQWGLAVLKAQANVAGAAAGQAVTFVLYGEAKFENVPAPAAGTTCKGSMNRAIFLRAKPGPQEAQVERLTAEADVTVLGRFAGGNWLRVQHGDKSGWVLSDSVRTSCEMNALPLASPDNVEPPPVMPEVRAFYFTSGIASQAECRDVPSGGMVISSPQGQKVSFNVNGADVTIGSTVVIRAIRGSQMVFTVLEGSATITIGTETFQLDAGEELVIPLVGITRPLAEEPSTNRQLANLLAFNLKELCKVTTAAGVTIPCEAVQDCSMNVVRFDAAPTSTQLRYDLSGVPLCQNVRLDWDVRGVETVKINGRTVTRSGGQFVCPYESTNYVLEMSCKGVTRTTSVTVNVQK